MNLAPDDGLFGLLGPVRLTAVVDIGANPIDGDPPYKDMLASGLCTLTGFEPLPEALAELDHRKGPHERYLPHAVGDGRPHILHVCRERGMSSLLPPDREQLGLFSEFAVHGLVEGEIKLVTRRLDDIEEIEAMDFLKIDIQGGELDVFKTGRRKLKRAVAIQTEVSFMPLYRGQPTFGAVDTFLRTLGFVPHCLAELKVRPLAPIVMEADPRRGMRQLLEADVVYVRDFSRTNGMEVEQWKHLAMIAHHCYSSFDLAYRAVAAVARLGAAAADAPDRYLRGLNAAGVSISAPGGPIR